MLIHNELTLLVQVDGAHAVEVPSLHVEEDVEGLLTRHEGRKRGETAHWDGWVRRTVRVLGRE